METVILALAVLVGVPTGAAGYIVIAEKVLSFVPNKRAARLRPWLWVAPAIIIVLIFLAYPSLNTIYLSFLNANSSEPVGFGNYRFVLSDQTMRIAIRNNVIWMVVFTTSGVGLGLLLAVLTDRVRYEPIAQALIFLPMAISYVAAGVIWRFVYEFRPAGTSQTGVLNGLLQAIVPGAEPQAWLVNVPLNNFALIAAAVWVWTGFCMVIFSATLKGIAVELIEAGRMDGANEFQLFRYVILPLLGPTIAVVTTTMMIFALKAFDIVYVMTNGNFETEVIANRMYKEMFNVRNFGRASAITVVLLVAIIPLMLINIRRFRQQEELR